MSGYTSDAVDLVRRDQSGRTGAHWRNVLPVLRSGDVVLREVRPSDAAVLASLLSTPQMTRYISTPPSSVEGFEQFIAASQRARANGEGACFTVTYGDRDIPVGLFQVRVTSPEDAATEGLSSARNSAEWGFAVAPQFWGTGVFSVAAALVLEFVFQQLGAHRLEARCALKNGRGGKALTKVGAVPEGILRKAILCGDEHLDQVLYAIVADDWRVCRDRCHSVTVTLVH